MWRRVGREQPAKHAVRNAVRCDRYDVDECAHGMAASQADMPRVPTPWHKLIGGLGMSYSATVRTGA